MKRVLIFLLILVAHFGFSQGDTNCVLSNLFTKIKSDPALSAAVKGDPKLVDSFGKLDDLGVDDALKTDPKFLKNVSDWDGGGATLSKNADGNLDLSDAAGKVDPVTGSFIVEHPGNFGAGFKPGGGVNDGLIQMNKVTAVYEEVSPGKFELITMYPNK